MNYLFGPSSSTAPYVSQKGRLDELQKVIETFQKYDSVLQHLSDNGYFANESNWKQIPHFNELRPIIPPIPPPKNDGPIPVFLQNSTVEYAVPYLSSYGFKIVKSNLETSEQNIPVAFFVTTCATNRTDLWLNVPPILKEKALQIIIILLFPGHEMPTITQHDGMPVITFCVSTVKEEVYSDSRSSKNPLSRKSLAKLIESCKATAGNLLQNNFKKKPSSQETNDKPTATPTPPQNQKIYIIYDKAIEKNKQYFTSLLHIFEPIEIDNSQLGKVQGKFIIVCNESIAQFPFSVSHTIFTKQFTNENILYVCGSWNDWKEDIKAKKVNIGWEVQVDGLTPLKSYEYKFKSSTGDWKFDDSVPTAPNTSNNCFTCPLPSSLVVINSVDAYYPLESYLYKLQSASSKGLFAFGCNAPQHVAKEVDTINKKQIDMIFQYLFS